MNPHGHSDQHARNDAELTPEPTAERTTERTAELNRLGWNPATTAIAAVSSAVPPGAWPAYGAGPTPHNAPRFPGRQGIGPISASPNFVAQGTQWDQPQPGQTNGSPEALLRPSGPNEAGARFAVPPNVVPLNAVPPYGAIPYAPQGAAPVQDNSPAHYGAEVHSNVPSEGAQVLRNLWSWVLAIVIMMFDLVAVTFLVGEDTENDALMLWAFGGLAATIVIAIMVYHRRTKTAVAFKVSAALTFVFPLSPLGPLVILYHLVRKATVKHSILATCVAALSVTLFCLRDAALPLGLGLFDLASDETVEVDAMGIGQYLVLGILLLVVPVLLGIVQRFRGRVEVLSKESRDLHVEAGDLKVELTRSQEREVIAREIHDTVAHHITRVAMQANLGEMRSQDPEAAKLFQGIRETSQGSMEEMRALISSLRDSASEGYVGATPIDLNAVRDLVNTMRKEGVNINADISIDELFSTSSVAASATYRIVREGLTNAVKYSKDTPVLLSLSALQGVGIFVEITNTADATKQMNSSNMGTGSGLLGMSERATQLGGYLHSSDTEGVWRLRSFLPATDRKSE